LSAELLRNTQLNRGINGLKIAIITTNGITSQFYSWPERLQARGLAGRGHQIKAYTYLGSKSWNRARQETIDGVAVRRMRQSWFSFSLWRELLLGERPDIVHLHHLSNQFNFSATLACKLRGVPVVITPHGLFHDPYLVVDRDRPFDAPPRYNEIIMRVTDLFTALRHQFKPKRHLKNFMTHAPLKMADRVIALSQHGRGVLLRLGLPDKRICIAPNAIDQNWLEGIVPAPKLGQPQILYLGQLKYRKGFDLLARAMPLIVKKFPQARFVFAGHSPVHQAELLRLVKESGLKGNVVLPGNLSEQDKAAYFLASDLYVLPTRYEGFGIPLLEAMSAGCPVVSSAIPVIDEIIKDGENGLLAPPENPTELAQVILRVLEDQNLQHHLIEGGRKAVAAYYTPLLIDQLERLYREVLTEKQARGWRSKLGLSPISRRTR